MRPAIVTLFVLLAPVAGAQPPEAPAMDVQGSHAFFRLNPMSEQGRWNVTFQWSCSTPELTLAARGHQTLTVAIASPPELQAAPSPSGQSVAAVAPSDCTDATVRHSVRVVTTLVARDSARALLPLGVWLNATLTQENAAGLNESWGPFPANATVVPLYRPVLQFVPRSHIQRVESGTPVAFPIDVANLGNGATRVSSRAVAPAASQGLVVEMPPDFVVAAPAAGKPGKTSVVVWATAEGDSDKVYPFEAVFNFTMDAPGTHASGEVRLPFSVRLGGLWDEVPGPAAVTQALVLVAAGMASAAVRRRG